MLPEYRDEISILKQENAHFRKIFEQHNDIDHKVTDATEGRSPLTDYEVENLKKLKLMLKDEMLKMILEFKKSTT